MIIAKFVKKSGDRRIMIAVLRCIRVSEKARKRTRQIKLVERTTVFDVASEV